MQKTGAVIAAASKAVAHPMQKVGSISLIKRVVSTLKKSGVDVIVVVTGIDEPDVKAQLVQEGVIFIHNKDFIDPPLISSIKIGLNYLKDKVERVFITPVNVPMFTYQTCKKMLETSGSIIVPSFEFHAGHPVLINHQHVQEIIDYEGTYGLRGFLKTKEAEKVYVKVDDPGTYYSIRYSNNLEKLVNQHNDSLIRPLVQLGIQREDTFFDGTSKLLLQLIDETGSVVSACKRMSLSQSKAWKLINALEKTLGTEIVQRRRGGSRTGRTKITQYGHEFLQKYEEYEMKTEIYAKSQFKKIFKQELALKEEKVMKLISESVRRKDSTDKAGGYAKYIDDVDFGDELYYGKFLRSTINKGEIKAIHFPEMPPEYTVVDKNDVTGENKIHVVLEDMPVYTDGNVEYIGDPILMIVGPDYEKCCEIVENIKVDYEVGEPILDPDTSPINFFEYEYEKGDLEKAFAEADFVHEEDVSTGFQEQGYLETQSMVAYERDGKLTVRGSLQCPYYVKTALKLSTGYPDDKIQVIQDMTGGAFGGKEDFPSILGTQVAVAAQKINHPIKVVFDREEDIMATSKKHPCKSHYKVAVKNGKVTAMDIDMAYDGGAYTTLSAVVLQRGIIGAPGVYLCDNVKVHGTARKTNTVPNGAYRGFGAPQAFFAIETVMNHVASKAGIDALEFKENNIAKQGDPTSTSGKYHFPVPLQAMIDELDEKIDYRNKRKAYANQTGRYRKGIGLSLNYHGCGFTGSGERDIIKAVAQLKKRKDDKIEILAAITEMGQGAHTTFSKIVGNVLGIPYDEIIFTCPDTDRVPDSGPTVASRSTMVVGELLRRCAEQIKEKGIPGEELIVEEHFKEPDFVIPFDLEHFHGDAYPAYSWSVNAVELEIDRLTGMHKVLGVYGNFDIGTPIDRNIIIGQMEGGMMQAIGYSSMENMHYDQNGYIRNNNFTDYLMPLSMDAPNMDVLLHVEEYPEGPFGAKGAGELPVVGGGAAYLEAVEQALGKEEYHLPFTIEDTLAAVMAEKKAK